MIDINVKGLYVSKAIIPQMIERKSGHIINIGSIAGKKFIQMETLLRLQTCC
jgi:NADP-dependent 3-hydroxy acid dehydrogenase YdfG